MRSPEQLMEQGAYTALQTFRDRCPSYVSPESKQAWQRGFGGASLRILRETFGARRVELPSLAATLQLCWRDRLRVLLTGRAEISIVGSVAIVGELQQVLPETRAGFAAPSVWATWQVQRAERRARRLQAAAEKRAADVATQTLPPAEPATRAEP